MEIQKNFNNDELVIYVVGKIDTITAPSFSEQIKADVEKANSVVLDLENVEYISSAGLRAIMVLHNTMEEKGGLVLRHVSGENLDVFETVGFNKFLHIQ